MAVSEHAVPQKFGKRCGQHLMADDTNVAPALLAASPDRPQGQRSTCKGQGGQSAGGAGQDSRGQARNGTFQGLLWVLGRTAQRWCIRHEQHPWVLGGQGLATWQVRVFLSLGYPGGQHPARLSASLLLSCER